MIIEKMPYRLNIQFFADGDDDNTPPSSGEDDLLAAIRSLKDSELNGDSDDDDDIEDDDIEDDDNQDDDILDDDDNDSDDNVDDDEPEDEQSKGKNKQSKEENAKFAQQRREREAQARAEAELERLKQQSPEFQLAKQLSDLYGQPPEVIMEQLREEQLKREAEQRKVPIEELREKRAEKERADRLEQEIALLKFNQWQTQIQSDGERLKNEYKILTQDDIEQATDYILNTAKNVNMPLEDAIFALHGKKIVQALAKDKVQDELANQSGRKKKTPLSPNNGKQRNTVSLSADEKAIARAFNMSDEEYAKYKS